MSKKGKMPIAIPAGVDVDIKENCVTVKGPKGTLKQEFRKGIKVAVADANVIITLEERAKHQSNFQGLYRSLIENMIIGVTKGFEKKLTLIGVGYRAAVKGRDLDLQIGLSHPTLLPIPEEIDVKVEKNTNLTITGIDKQSVGQFAANIRSKQPPEPYQGKGIRYENEYVRKKAGKSAGK